MKYLIKFEQNYYFNAIGEKQWHSAGNVYTVTESAKFTKTENGDLRVLFKIKTSKDKRIQFGKGVKLIEGTPLGATGSNKYPYPHFKERYCIVEIEGEERPIVDDTFWKITYL
jgi:hypothetical protein